MTTPAAEALYLAQHLYSVEGKPYAVFNPENKPVESLPIIYGFNNGGRAGWMDAKLMSEDGAALGGHCCSHEGYMPHDLGVIEGSRPDRHEGFKKHYPSGYRMAFIGYNDVETHEGLKMAIARYEEREKASARATEDSQTKDNALIPKESVSHPQRSEGE